MPLVITDQTAGPVSWSDFDVANIVHWTGRPARDEIRQTLRAAGTQGIVVNGSLPTLHIVVEGLHRSGRAEEVPVGFVPGPGSDEETAMFCQLLGLDGDIQTALDGDPVKLSLVRDDIGGVLLHSGEITRTPSLKPFGVQAFNDDAMIANGKVGAIRVVPDYGNTELGVRASVVPPGRGSTKRTLGRAVQIACDEIHVELDGVELETTLTKRTWYVDDRVHWLLRGATIPLPYEPEIPGPDRNPFRLRRRL